MLSAQNRMRNGSDFTGAVRRGRRAGRRSLVVHCSLHAPGAPGSPGDPVAGAGSAASPPLVGFVVPKSVGTAVVRNRVQRRLRHLMRERVSILPPGCRIVVRAQPASASASDLASDLDGALAEVLRAPRRRSAP